MFSFQHRFPSLFVCWLCVLLMMNTCAAFVTVPIPIIINHHHHRHHAKLNQWYHHHHRSIRSNNISCRLWQDVLSHENESKNNAHARIKKRERHSTKSKWFGKSNKNIILSTLLIAGIVSAPIEMNLDVSSSSSSSLSHLPHSTVAVVVQPSRAYALTEQQLLVSDVWKEVTRKYIDTTYNGLGEEGWKEKRLEAVTKVRDVGPDDTELVYTAIRNMLKYLDDPYTRFLSPVQYESIVAVAKGGNVGIGVQLAVDPRSEYVVVGNVVPDGPAKKAGLLPGDNILEVDGFDVRSTTAEFVAAKLRGEVGTNVNIFLRHGGPNGPEKEITPYTITREQLKVNPVRATTFVSSASQKKIGLLVVTSFNQETVTQVMDGMKKLKGCATIVIDLRGNLGGYMPAGVDVAKLFLKPQDRIITEVDKGGKSTLYINDGVGSETTLPLYVLVDDQTASASEILTAALQDNDRAIVVGTTAKTFGKGRIQNIQPVGDGCAVSVTRAKYITPKGNDIHKKGITPDTILVSDPDTNICERDDPASKCLLGIV